MGILCEQGWSTSAELPYYHKYELTYFLFHSNFFRVILNLNALLKIGLTHFKSVFLQCHSKKCPYCKVAILSIIAKLSFHKVILQSMIRPSVILKCDVWQIVILAVYILQCQSANCHSVNFCSVN